MGGVSVKLVDLVLERDLRAHVAQAKQASASTLRCVRFLPVPAQVHGDHVAIRTVTQAQAGTIPYRGDMMCVRQQCNGFEIAIWPMHGLAATGTAMACSRDNDGACGAVGMLAHDVGG